MIAKIEKPYSNFSGIVDYHDKKIESGNATILLSPSFDNDKKSIKEALNDIANLNENVKNKCLHISLNLLPGEVVSNDKFIEIANDYLNGMGWNNSPFVLYHHNDKDHQHVHIVLSTVDFEGNKIDDGNSFYKSATLTRSLETKHNLATPSKSDKVQKSLNEVNRNKYHFSNSLKKGLKDFNLKDSLAEILSEKEINTITKGTTNEQTKALIGDDRYNHLYAIFDKKGYLRNLVKDDLIKKLDYLYALSQTHEEFINKLSSNNIYIRELTKNGQSHYVYGLKAEGYYYKDTRLPKTYSHKELTNHFGPYKIGSKMSEFKQRRFVYNQISLALKSANGYDEFKSLLQNEGMRVIEKYDDKNALCGISFAMPNVANPVEFDGSNVAQRFSFEKLTDHFTTVNPIPNFSNDAYNAIESDQSNLIDKSDGIEPVSTPHLSQPDNNFEYKKNSNKKKKRRHGTEPDRQL